MQHSSTCELVQVPIRLQESKFPETVEIRCSSWDLKLCHRHIATGEFWEEEKLQRAQQPGHLLSDCFLSRILSADKIEQNSWGWWYLRGRLLQKLIESQSLSSQWLFPDITFLLQQFSATLAAFYYLTINWIIWK